MNLKIVAYGYMTITLTAMLITDLILHNDLLGYIGIATPFVYIVYKAVRGSVF